MMLWSLSTSFGSMVVGEVMVRSIALYRGGAIALLWGQFRHLAVPQYMGGLSSL